MGLQVDETIGFADDEDPSDGLVSDRRDEGAYLEEPDKESAVMAEGLPKVTYIHSCDHTLTSRGGQLRL